MQTPMFTSEAATVEAAALEAAAEDAGAAEAASEDAGAAEEAELPPEHAVRADPIIRAARINATAFFIELSPTFL